MSFVYRIVLEITTKNNTLLVYDVYPQRTRLDTTAVVTDTRNYMAVSPITNIVFKPLSTDPETALHLTADIMMQTVMYLQPV